MSKGSPKKDGFLGGREGRKMHQPGNLGLGARSRHKGKKEQVEWLWRAGIVEDLR